MKIEDTLKHVAAAAERALQEALDNAEDLKNERIRLEAKIISADGDLVTAQTYAADARHVYINHRRTEKDGT